MIALESIWKRFANKPVLQDLSLELRPNEVTTFLGPNGAGKSTTMRILAGTLQPDMGKRNFKGQDCSDDPRPIQKSLGYLPENNPLYGDFTVIEQLELVAAIKGLSKRAIQKQVSLCELTDVLKTPISALSKGYRQRVGLALALMGEPELLLLDEPGTGLDPNQAQRLGDLIAQMGYQSCLLLSTHQLDQVERWCQRILIMNHGKLIFDGSPQRLRQDHGQDQLEIHFPEQTPATAEWLASQANIERCQQQDDHVLLEGEFRDADLSQLNQALVERGTPPCRLFRRHASLQDIFTRLTEASP